MPQAEGTSTSPSLQHSGERYNNSPTNDVDTVFEGTTPSHVEMQHNIEPKVLVLSSGAGPRKLGARGFLACVHLPEDLQPSLRLQNSGSVARDHLASERTFLAYVRTSLAMASVGVAIVQLFTVSDLILPNQAMLVPPATMKIKDIARPVGASMVLLGIIIVIIGALFCSRLFVLQRFF